ncbi:hypothetical protein PHYSODRAFT_321362 [Phytophthora sojae]|uniref:Uncharacterized protein n=1 Tax=Phytophthora sojae (strain P6497) TaxID=1094619 RepID=G4YM38_PHYSP|nr:hypothetical protein PHYSODRAFT_321362 [Phytophthora sojae]EGZ27568.1 hypothetical protein PHYSODRAFT_321362 [Phytophthora sojae]|eukprot:XP_009514843.1 hypothetical protein PHYSODRAFT_321362 [Phytophthora sojae]
MLARPGGTRVCPAIGRRVQAYLSALATTNATLGAACDAKEATPSVAGSDVGSTCRNGRSINGGDRMNALALRVAALGAVLTRCYIPSTDPTMLARPGGTRVCPAIGRRVQAYLSALATVRKRTNATLGAACDAKEATPSVAGSDVGSTCRNGRSINGGDRMNALALRVAALGAVLTRCYIPSTDPTMLARPGGTRVCPAIGRRVQAYLSALATVRKRTNATLGAACDAKEATPSVAGSDVGSTCRNGRSINGGDRMNALALRVAALGAVLTRCYIPSTDPTMLARPGGTRVCPAIGRRVQAYLSALATTNATLGAACDAKEATPSVAGSDVGSTCRNGRSINGGDRMNALALRVAALGAVLTRCYIPSTDPTMLARPGGTRVCPAIGRRVQAYLSALATTNATLGAACDAKEATPSVAGSDVGSTCRNGRSINGGDRMNALALRVAALGAVLTRCYIPSTDPTMLARPGGTRVCPAIGRRVQAYLSALATTNATLGAACDAKEATPSVAGSDVGSTCRNGRSINGGDRMNALALRVAALGAVLTRCYIPSTDPTMLARPGGTRVCPAIGRRVQAYLSALATTNATLGAACDAKEATPSVAGSDVGSTCRNGRSINGGDRMNALALRVAALGAVLTRCYIPSTDPTMLARPGGTRVCPAIGRRVQAYLSALATTNATLGAACDAKEATPSVAGSDVGSTCRNGRSINGGDRMNALALRVAALGAVLTRCYIPSTDPTMLARPGGTRVCPAIGRRVQAYLSALATTNATLGAACDAKEATPSVAGSDVGSTCRNGRSINGGDRMNALALRVAALGAVLTRCYIPSTDPTMLARPGGTRVCPAIGRRVQVYLSALATTNATLGAACDAKEATPSVAGSDVGSTCRNGRSINGGDRMNALALRVAALGAVLTRCYIPSTDPTMLARPGGTRVCPAIGRRVQVYLSALATTNATLGAACDAKEATPSVAGSDVGSTCRNGRSINGGDRMNALALRVAALGAVLTRCYIPSTDPTMLARPGGTRVCPAIGRRVQAYLSALATTNATLGAACDAKEATPSVAGSDVGSTCRNGRSFNGGDRMNALALRVAALGAVLTRCYIPSTDPTMLARPGGTRVCPAIGRRVQAYLSALATTNATLGAACDAKEATPSVAGSDVGSTCRNGRSINGGDRMNALALRVAALGAVLTRCYIPSTDPTMLARPGGTRVCPAIGRRVQAYLSALATTNATLGAACDAKEATPSVAGSDVGSTCRNGRSINGGDRMNALALRVAALGAVLTRCYIPSTDPTMLARPGGTRVCPAIGRRVQAYLSALATTNATLGAACDAKEATRSVAGSDVGSTCRNGRSINGGDRMNALALRVAALGAVLTRCYIPSTDPTMLARQGGTRVCPAIGRRVQAYLSALATTNATLGAACDAKEATPSVAGSDVGSTCRNGRSFNGGDRMNALALRVAALGAVLTRCYIPSTDPTMLARPGGTRVCPAIGRRVQVYLSALATTNATLGAACDAKEATPSVAGSDVGSTCRNGRSINGGDRMNALALRVAALGAVLTRCYIPSTDPTMLARPGGTRVCPAIGRRVQAYLSALATTNATLGAACDAKEATPSVAGSDVGSTCRNGRSINGGDRMNALALRVAALGAVLTRCYIPSTDPTMLARPGGTRVCPAIGRRVQAYLSALATTNATLGAACDAKEATPSVAGSDVGSTCRNGRSINGGDRMNALALRVAALGAVLTRCYIPSTDPTMLARQGGTRVCPAIGRRVQAYLSALATTNATLGAACDAKEATPSVAGSDVGSTCRNGRSINGGDRMNALALRVAALGAVLTRCYIPSTDPTMLARPGGTRVCPAIGRRVQAYLSALATTNATLGAACDAKEATPSVAGSDVGSTCRNGRSINGGDRMNALALRVAALGAVLTRCYIPSTDPTMLARPGGTRVCPAIGRRVQAYLSALATTNATLGAACDAKEATPSVAGSDVGSTCRNGRSINGGDRMNALALRVAALGAVLTRCYIPSTDPTMLARPGGTRVCPAIGRRVQAYLSALATTNATLGAACDAKEATPSVAGSDVGSTCRNGRSINGGDRMNALALRVAALGAVLTRCYIPSTDPTMLARPGGTRVCPAIGRRVQAYLSALATTNATLGAACDAKEATPSVAGSDVGSTCRNGRSINGGDRMNALALRVAALGAVLTRCYIPSTDPSMLARPGGTRVCPAIGRRVQAYLSALATTNATLGAACDAKEATPSVAGSDVGSTCRNGRSINGGDRMNALALRVAALGAVLTRCYIPSTDPTMLARPGGTRVCPAIGRRVQAYLSALATETNATLGAACDAKEATPSVAGSDVGSTCRNGRSINGGDRMNALALRVAALGAVLTRCYIPSTDPTMLARPGGTRVCPAIGRRVQAYLSALATTNATLGAACDAKEATPSVAGSDVGSTCRNGRSINGGDRMNALALRVAALGAVLTRCYIPSTDPTMLARPGGTRVCPAIGRRVQAYLSALATTNATLGAACDAKEATPSVAGSDVGSTCRNGRSINGGDRMNALALRVAALGAVLTRCYIPSTDPTMLARPGGTRVCPAIGRRVQAYLSALATTNATLGAACDAKEATPSVAGSDVGSTCRNGRSINGGDRMNALALRVAALGAVLTRCYIPSTDPTMLARPGGTRVCPAIGRRVQAYLSALATTNATLGAACDAKEATPSVAGSDVGSTCRNGRSINGGDRMNALALRVAALGAVLTRCYIPSTDPTMLARPGGTRVCPAIGRRVQAYLSALATTNATLGAACDAKEATPSVAGSDVGSTCRNGRSINGGDRMNALALRVAALGAVLTRCYIPSTDPTMLARPGGTRVCPAIGRRVQAYLSALATTNATLGAACDAKEATPSVAGSDVGSTCRNGRSINGGDRMNALALRVAALGAVLTRCYIPSTDPTMLARPGGTRVCPAIGRRVQVYLSALATTNATLGAACDAKEATPSVAGSDVGSTCRNGRSINGGDRMNALALRVAALGAVLTRCYIPSTDPTMLARPGGTRVCPAIGRRVQVYLSALATTNATLGAACDAKEATPSVAGSDVGSTCRNGRSINGGDRMNALALRVAALGAVLTRCYIPSTDPTMLARPGGTRVCPAIGRRVQAYLSALATTNATLGAACDAKEATPSVAGSDVGSTCRNGRSINGGDRMNALALRVAALGAVLTRCYIPSTDPTMLARPGGTRVCPAIGRRVQAYLSALATTNATLGAACDAKEATPSVAGSDVGSTCRNGRSINGGDRMNALALRVAALGAVLTRCYIPSTDPTMLARPGGTRVCPAIGRRVQAYLSALATTNATLGAACDAKEATPSVAGSDVGSTCRNGRSINGGDRMNALALRVAALGAVLTRCYIPSTDPTMLARPGGTRVCPAIGRRVQAYLSALATTNATLGAACDAKEATPSVAGSDVGSTCRNGRSINGGDRMNALALRVAALGAVLTRCYIPSTDPTMLARPGGTRVCPAIGRRVQAYLSALATTNATLGAACDAKEATRSVAGSDVGSTCRNGRSINGGDRMNALALRVAALGAVLTRCYIPSTDPTMLARPGGTRVCPAIGRRVQAYLSALATTNATLGAACDAKEATRSVAGSDRA